MGFIAERKPRINKTLISLKFVVFFVITGEYCSTFKIFVFNY